MSHRWSFAVSDGNTGAMALSGASGSVADPIREFLDEATNRLAPSVSDALRASLKSWIADGGRVLLSVDPQDNDVLTAVLPDDGSSGESIIELRLTSTNGLWLRNRGQSNYSLVGLTSLELLDITTS